MEALRIGRGKTIDDLFGLESDNMFLIILSYVKPLDEVDKYIDDHIRFLDKYYKEEKFVFSGRRNPRMGGLILINSKNETEVKQIINEDPFHVNKIAEYEIIEFTPTKFDPRFSVFVES
jgi:uncharacterized protein YciI